MRAYLGIDPGLSGGIAYISEAGAVVKPAPTMASAKGEEMDLCGMRSVLLVAKALGARAVIEKVSAMPKQGVSSTFKFGRGFGSWLGMLAALEIPFEYATPQAWQKVMLAGLPRGKEASIQRAQELFPGVSLLPTAKCRKPSDGMAEALLIAEFNRRRG